MIRFLVAIPLVMHGLANLAGALAFSGRTPEGFTGQPSILLPKYRMNSTFGKVWSLVWLCSSLGLVTAGLAAIFENGIWLTLAIAGSVLSLAAIVPWWNTVPPGARFGAIFDVLVIAILLSPIGDWLMTVILAS